MSHWINEAAQEIREACQKGTVDFGTERQIRQIIRWHHDPWHHDHLCPECGGTGEVPLSESTKKRDA